MSKILFAFLFIVQLFSQESDFVPVFKEQRISQGEKHFEIAMDLFKDKKYKESIVRLNDFLFLFPGHPSTLKSLKLLSLSQKKSNQYYDSIKTDILTYKEFPTTEDGISSYLDAGKKLFYIGRNKEAKDILEIVKNQMYSSKIAKEAEIELKQHQILEEEPSYFKEDLTKNENIQNPIK